MYTVTGVYLLFGVRFNHTTSQQQWVFYQSEYSFSRCCVWIHWI